MYFKKIFSSRARRRQPLSWQKSLERFRVVRLVFIRLILLLSDGLCKEHCIAASLFWKECWRLKQKSGFLFLSLYLKQCRVAVQKVCAGDSVFSPSPAISLTRSGVPRIIPSFHRKRIKEKDPVIVQMYLSFFSISKVIALAKRVDGSLFDSISSPPIAEPIEKMTNKLFLYIKPLLRRYVPGIDNMALNQGLCYKPTWKALPSSSWYKDADRETPLTKEQYKLLTCSIFGSLPLEMATFKSMSLYFQNFLAREGDCTQEAIWPEFIRYPFDPGNDLITRWGQTWARDRIIHHMPNLFKDFGMRYTFGRLAQSCTGDGKRRLFAIGNYINQRLLYPFHDWLMSVLKRIPMDGTFDQAAPLDRLSGVKGPVYSVDLKSATDRWPIRLLLFMAFSIFGKQFASSAVHCALYGNTFLIGFIQEPKFIGFKAGQPLGFYSSWPLFALSHHFVIWYCAELIYPGKVFRRYAILGDDVVIADEKVKKLYYVVIDRLGVKVSPSKTLQSDSGCGEFAKRFRLDRLTVDVSPISLKMLLTVDLMMSWYSNIASRPVRLSTKLSIS